MASQTVKELIQVLPQEGQIDWIGLRRERRGEVESVTSTAILEGLGLEGDHRTQGKKPRPSGKRHVTLIQAEHLAAVASMLGLDEVKAEWTRRNIMVSGINLLALKDRQFYLGEALLEGTGSCHPCSRMEDNLGAGGYNAMRGHGGITARVVKGGKINLGDKVKVAE